MSAVSTSKQTQAGGGHVRGDAVIQWAVLVIFFLSGTAALIDQIVWTRALHRVFGVTAEAASTVLAAFMVGLAAGSHIFGRWADRGINCMRMYGWMELAIGLLAPLTLWLFRAMQPGYAALAQTLGLESPILPVARAGLCVLVLLPPTVLMGGTLPVLAKVYLQRQPGRVVALLYSMNTWGAVLGCFLAGFVMLGTLGETRSLLVASGGNLVAALWAFRRSGTEGTPKRATLSPVGAYGGRSIVYGVSFVNGFAALGLEVLWGRTLGLISDASVYSYTCIIGTFLIGIALGSRLVAGWADRSRSPLVVLGIMSGIMSVLVCVSLRVFFQFVPGGAIGGGLMQIGDSAMLVPLKMMGLAAGAILPVTILSGACFPFMAKLVIPGDGREGRELGGLYSINTIGGILGAALAGFAMLPILGDRNSFAAISLLYAGSAGACWLVASRRGLALAGTALVTGAVLAILPSGGGLSRQLVERWGGSVARHVETPAGTVSALTLPNGQKHLLVNGHGMTILCTDTKYMAHLPLLLHPNPTKILVICFGMGTTFRSAAAYPIDVTAVELQPAVPKMFDYFHADAERIRSDAGRRIRIADGRNFLLVSPERYSVITVDPAPPMHSAGTVNLYTKEFFELCASHLDDDGVMCMWIPNEACTFSDFRLLMKTFRSVFPHAQLWYGPEGFGYYLVGSRKPLVVRPDRLSVLARDPSVLADLREYRGGPTLFEHGLRERFIMGNRGIDRLIGDEPRILTDDRPYTEFPWLQWAGYGQDIWKNWMTPDKLARLIEAPDENAFPRP